MISWPAISACQRAPICSHGFEVGSHLLVLIGSGCCASSLAPVRPHARGGGRFRGQLVPRPFPAGSQPHWKNQVALPENGTSLSTGPTFLSSSRIAPRPPMIAYGPEHHSNSVGQAKVDDCAVFSQCQLHQVKCP